MTPLEDNMHRRWLAEAMEVMSHLGIEGTIIGGVAAIRYRSELRLTRDLDLLADKLGGLEAELEKRGYNLTVFRDDKDNPYLIRAHRDEYYFDFMLADTEYQRTAITRAIDGVITPEDVIIHKLIAWRDRDRDDVRSIVEAGHDLDSAYIQKWAVEWGVEDRLPQQLALANGSTQDLSAQSDD